MGFKSPARRVFNTTASCQGACHLVEAIHPRILLHELRDMLHWYEEQICSATFVDPRGHRVQFRPEQFPHLIKLLQKGSQREVNNPQQHILDIKNGRKANADYGGYQPYRFQRLTSIHAIIARPDEILELIARPIVGKKRSGDTLYIKEFRCVPPGCRFEVLVCRRVTENRLEAITCHPQNHGNFSRSQYKRIYP